jgi:hypothetical protein
VGVGEEGVGGEVVVHEEGHEGGLVVVGADGGGVEEGRDRGEGRDVGAHDQIRLAELDRRVAAEGMIEVLKVGRVRS